MWSMCGPLLVVMSDWGYDYMPELMVPVLNYITKDVTTFLVGFHGTDSRTSSEGGGGLGGGSPGTSLDGLVAPVMAMINAR